MSMVAAPYLLDHSQNAYVATCIHCHKTVGFVSREFLAAHRIKAPLSVYHECEATPTKEPDMPDRYSNGYATLITQHETEQEGEE